MNDEIKGLKGIYDLSNEDFEIWKQEQIKLGKLTNKSSMKYADKLYRNQQFIELYGKNLFDQLPQDEIYKYHETMVVNKALYDKFGTQDNFNDILSLDIENKKKVYSTIKPDSFFEKQKDVLKKEQEEKRTKEKSIIQQIGEGLAMGETSITPEYVQYKSNQGAQRSVETLAEFNRKELQNIIDQDRLNKGKDDDAKVYSEQLYKAMCNSSTINVGNKTYDTDQFVKDKFEKIGNGYTETINDSFGKPVQITYNGSNYYKAFSDTDIIKQMSDQVKAELVGTYEVMRQKYGNIVADQIFNTQLQKYISEQQGFFEKEWSDLKNIGLGTTAYLMDKVLGTVALGIAVTEGDEALAKFMHGVDENGNLTSWFLNPTYWNGVDMYNTFDISEINRANHNGGISPYNIVYESGEVELFSEQTYHEVKRQTKYIAGAMIDAMLTRGAGGLITKGATKATTKALMNKFITGSIVAGSGIGMAEIEGKIVFDQTLREADLKLQEKKYQDARNYANQEITKNENQALIESVVQQKIEEVRQQQQLLTMQQTIEGNFMIPHEIDETAIREQVVNDFIQEKQREYLEASEQNGIYNEDYEQALRNAADAYEVTATIQYLRETASNVLWGQYKFDKGTKATLRGNPLGDNIRVKGNNVVSDLTTVGKVKQYTKNLVNPMWEGFSSEFMDGVTENFGEGFGLGKYNNYLARKYNPEEVIRVNDAYLGDWLSGIQYATDNATLAFSDSNTWYEAWIGLISPMTTITPKFDSFIGKENRQNTIKDNQGKSFMYKFNSYINNPLTDGYFTVQYDINNHQETVDRLNKVVQEQKEKIEDIQTQLINYSHYAYSKIENNDVQTRDNKILGAIDLMKLIDEWQQDELLSQTDIVKQARQDLQTILEDNLSEEEWTKLIEQYKVRNKGTIDTDEQIKERIIENISKLNDNYTKYKENLKFIEERTKSSTPVEVKDQLAKMMVLEDSYKERISSMETELKGDNNINEGVTPEAIYGSYTHYKQAIEQKEKLVKNLNDRIEKAKKELKEYKRLFYKVPKYIQEQGITKEMLINSTKLDLNTVNELLLQEKSNLKTMQEHEQMYKDQEGNTMTYVNKVFSAQEIINLRPEERYQMLFFEDNYSPEQRLEIQNAKRLLQQKDFLYYNKVKDIVTLQQRLSESEIARERLENKENAEFVSQYVTRLQQLRAFNAQKAVMRYATEKIENDLNKTTTFQELIDIVYNYNNSKGLSAEVLETYLNKHKERNTDEAQELVKALKAQKDASLAMSKILDSNNVDARTQSNFFYSLASVLKNTKSVSEVMDTLEKVLQTSDDTFFKETLSKVLDKMVEMNYQRNSTITQTTKKKTEKTEKTEEIKPKEKEVKTGEENFIQGSEQEVNLFDSPSPTLEQQVITANNPEVQIVQLSGSDQYSVANDISTTADNLLAGNPFVEYDNKLLATQGKMQHKQGLQEFDSMNQFYSWLKDNNIQMQEIIDNELGNIIKNNPDIKVQFLFRKPQVFADHADTLQNQIILVIENDDKVSKFHNKERGSLHVNGKEYLVIGSVWADFRNPNQKNNFISMQQTMQRKRKQYFDANPTEEYYIDDVYYTQINQLTTGYLVRQLSSDKQVQYRGVAELANGEINERNPEGLSIQDLKWGIVIGDKILTIGVNERNTIFPLKQLSSNTGNVFLFIKSANGKYIPAQIKPIMYNELTDSTLKTRINNLLSQLTSINYNNRVNAREELKKLLSFNKEKSIHTKNDGIVTIISNYGKTIETFKIDENFDRTIFFNKIRDLKFRVNITEEVLQSPSTIKEYSDAGVLSIDLAKLGTANGIFDIYSCNEDGTPNVTTNINWNIAPSKQEIIKEKSIIINNKIYRIVDNKFFDEFGNEITDEKTLNNLSIIREINKRNLNSIYIEDNQKFYVIKEGENPIVIKIDSNNNVITLNNIKSKNIIDKVNALIEQKNREEAAKNALVTEENSTIVSIEDVNLSDETLTEEQIANQFLGNFDSLTENQNQQTTDNQKINTNVTETQKKTKLDINTSNSNILNQLHSSEKSTTFAEIYKSKENNNRIFEILVNKGWGITEDSTIGGIKKILLSKNMPIENITDIENWIDILKNCR